MTASVSLLRSFKSQEKGRLVKYQVVSKEGIDEYCKRLIGEQAVQVMHRKFDKVKGFTLDDIRRPECKPVMISGSNEAPHQE